MGRKITVRSKIHPLSDFKCRDCDKNLAPVKIAEHLYRDHTVEETRRYPDMVMFQTDYQPVV